MSAKMSSPAAGSGSLSAPGPSQLFVLLSPSERLDKPPMKKNTRNAQCSGDHLHQREGVLESSVTSLQQSKKPYLRLTTVLFFASTLHAVTFSADAFRQITTYIAVSDWLGSQRGDQHRRVRLQEYVFTDLPGDLHTHAMMVNISTKKIISR